MVRAQITPDERRELKALLSAYPLMTEADARNRAYGRHLRALSKGRHEDAIRAATSRGEQPAAELILLEDGYTWRCPCGCRTPDTFPTREEAQTDFDQGHGRFFIMDEW